MKRQETREIPEGWKVTTLGEVAELVKEPWKPGEENHKYIGLEHIGQGDLQISGYGDSSKLESNKFHFKTNDVLFGKLRPYFRKVWRARFDGVCSTDIWVIRSKPGFDQRFLFYFMANTEVVNRSSGASIGTKMPRADWDFLGNTKWGIPPLQEQKAIAAVLSSLDDKIELLRRQNKTLENIAQALFKRWFVDFEFPNEKGKPYKSSGGKMVNSELGPIPEGWRVGGLGDYFADYIPGEWGKDEKMEPDMIEVFCIRGTDLPDLKSGSDIRAPLRYITAKKLKRSNILKGDLVVEISGGTIGQSTGRIAYITVDLINRLKKNLVASNFCKVLRLNDINIQTYIYIYWEYLYHSGLFFNYENGTTGIQNLNLKGVLAHDVCIPENIAVNMFSTVAGNYLKKIQKNNSQISNLSRTRDSLIPKLLHGELRVKGC